MLNIVVFASGRGSNAKAIFELCEENPELISICALITNNANAGVIEHAEHFGIPTHVVPVIRRSTRKETRANHEHRITAVLESLNFNYICLAGYMRILTEEFINAYPHPNWPCSSIINIHPALLPSFKGTHGYEDAFDHGVRVAGVTTHFVSAEVDSGPIINQRYFKRYAADTLTDFKTRGLSEEHRCYRQTLMALATDTLIVNHQPFQLFMS